MTIKTGILLAAVVAPAAFGILPLYVSDKSIQRPMIDRPMIERPMFARPMYSIAMVDRPMLNGPIDRPMLPMLNSASIVTDSVSFKD